MSDVVTLLQSALPNVWEPTETLRQWISLIAVVLTVWVGHFLFVRQPHSIVKANSRKAAKKLKQMEAMLAYASKDAERAEDDRSPPEASRVLELLWDETRECRTHTYGFAAAHPVHMRVEALYRERWAAEVRKAIELTRCALDPAAPLPVSSHTKDVEDHRGGTKLHELLVADRKVRKDLGSSFGVEQAVALEGRAVVREAYARQKNNLGLLFGMLRPSLPMIIYSIAIDVLITALRAYFHQLGTWMECIEAGVAGDMARAQSLLYRQWLGHMLIKILELPMTTYIKRCRTTFGNAVRNGVLSAMVRQDYEYFDKNDTGVLQERLNRDADELGENLVDFPKNMLTRTIWVLANLFLVWRQAPLAFFSMACMPVMAMMVFQYFSFKQFRRCNELARKVDEEGVSETSEVLRQIKTVRQFASEGSAAANYAQRALNRQIVAEGVFVGKRIFEAAAWMVFDSGICYTVLLGFPFVAAGEMRPSQLMDCFCKLNFNINFTMREILEELPRVSKLLEPLGRICTLLQAKPAIEPAAAEASAYVESCSDLTSLLSQCEVRSDVRGDKQTRVAGGGLPGVARGAQLTHLATADYEHISVSDWHELEPGKITFPVRALFSTKLRPARFHGKIEFRNVHFAFPTELRKPILNGISFTIEPGQKVALVGPTGCGKSCCMKLLQRLYEPQAGQILIDDVPIEQYDIHFLRSRIVIVDQDTTLFSATIRENVTYGLEHEVSDEEVVQACRAAKAWEFIEEMPDQLMTMLKAGENLSGGQRQRLAIARAIIRDPDVILLDEATSALDNENEAKVQLALDELARRGSALVIAHRLSTIKDSDQILVVDRGRVAEAGTHDELLSSRCSLSGLPANATLLPPGHELNGPPRVARASSGDAHLMLAPKARPRTNMRRTMSMPNLLAHAASDKASYRKLWEAAEGGNAAKSISSLQAKIDQAEAALQALRQSHASMVQRKEQLLSPTGRMLDGLVSFGRAPHPSEAKPRERQAVASGGSSPDEVIVARLTPRAFTV